MKENETQMKETQVRERQAGHREGDIVCKDTGQRQKKTKGETKEDTCENDT